MAIDLITSAQNGNVAGVKEALDAGVDVNLLDSGHDTALTWSAYKGHTEVVRLLLARGADISIPNKSGSTPLALAKGYGNAETVKLLELAAIQSRESWHKMGEAAVAHIGIYTDIAQKITSIFNFKSRDRLVTTLDLEKNLQSTSAATSFDALGPAAVEEALEQFTKLGGVADRDYVLSGASALGKPKLRAAGATS